MNQYHIEIKESFNAPVDVVFARLTDHREFGRVINTDIKCIVKSQDNNKNGKGSVRRIKNFLIPAFEETVTEFEQDKLMGYRLSKGSPIKNHKGRMEFFSKNNTTYLYYTIDFKVKLPFILLGPLLKKMIEKSLVNGLSTLAEEYENSDGTTCSEGRTG